MFILQAQALTDTKGNVLTNTVNIFNEQAPLKSDMSAQIRHLS